MRNLHTLTRFLLHSVTRQRRRLGCLLGVILLVGLVAFGYKSWQLYQIGRDIVTDVRAVRTLARSWHEPAALADLEPLLARIRTNTALLRDEAGPLLPLTHLLGWVPVYGADLTAVEPLLDTAVSLTIAADETYAALAPALIEREPDESIRVVLVRYLVPPPAQLATARQALAQAADAWSHVPLDHLSPRTRSYLAPVETFLPLAQDTLDLVPVLPDMLGANGPRDYLFLAQNPDELRATGGFIGAAGILTLKGGRVAEFSLQHSGSVNDFAAGPYPAAPNPLRRYMHIDPWAFQDANWSPDFPTTAHVAMDLYRRGQGRTVDGVIAATPGAMQLLLAVTGPLAVPDVAEPVSAENLQQYIQTEFDRELEAEPGQERKAYLGRLAEAMIAKLDADLERMDAPALMQAFRQALDERHLLLYTQEPDAAAFLARREWDGAVQPGVSDFLLVVDANVGYNKVNGHIEQRMAYTVDLSDPRSPVATLMISHTNRLNTTGPCRQWRGDAGPLRYAQVADNCYWNYLRVLVPRGSQLVGIRTNPVPGEWMLSGRGDTGTVTVSQGEAGTHVLSTFLVVPFDETRVTVLRYRLPPGVLTEEAYGWHYRLKLQKQSGREAIPVTLRIDLPPQATLISAAPAPVRVSDHSLVVDLDLARDQTLDVIFRQP
jgi:hypothetical protein